MKKFFLYFSLLTIVLLGINVYANTTPEKSEANNSNITVDKLPQEYLQAIQEAREISARTHDSKEIIYGELILDINHRPFPPEVAKYAVDNAGIDYKQNALLKAEKWLRTATCSKEEFRKYLKNWGYLAEEINYAMQNSKVDYKRNAYLRSAVYAEAGWSKTETYNFLREDGFTEKQALYAVSLRYK